MIETERRTMTVKDGLPDKRKAKGVQRKQAFPKDKLGKYIQLDDFYDIKTELYIPDAENFKTVQASLTGWIHVESDMTTEILDRVLYLCQKRIKDLIRNWQQQMFHQQSIVVFKTADKPKRNIRESQYLTLDLVLFVKPLMIFDRHSITAMVEPFIKNVIENHIMGHQEFEITRNLKMEARKFKNKRVECNVE